MFKEFSLIISFCSFLEEPNARDLDCLKSKQRKVDEMYEKVFCKAAELGRTEELFHISPDQKSLHEANRAYLEAIDEAELLGEEATWSPRDFFVSLQSLFIIFSAKYDFLNDSF